MTALGNLARRRNAAEVAVRGKPPVPLAPTHGVTMPLGMGGPGDDIEQLSLMAANGTTYSVIDLLSRDTASYTNSWHLYRVDTTTSRGRIAQPDPSREVQTHAALDLWFQPNDWFDNNLFIWATQQHIEATGKAFWVMTMTPYGPIDMWLVRPDRMTPVPDPNGFLLGWIYSAPTGEQIAVPAAECVWIRQPDPMDLYGGLSPATPLQTDIESGRAISQWNRNFFANSAQPGGVVQLPEGISLNDQEFRKATSRWAEQHMGVSRAHRIAFLENGATWQNTAYSMKDMQFVELRQDARNSIYEGWGVGGGMLGVVEDVNRANMEGTEYNYTKRKIQPRLAMYRGVLNGQFLAKFGATATGLAFDFDNPVPADWQADAETMQAQATAVATYVAAGFAAEQVLKTVGVPEMDWEAPAAPIMPPQLFGAPAVAPPSDEMIGAIRAIAHRLGQVEQVMVRSQIAAANAPALLELTARIDALSADAAPPAGDETSGGDLEQHQAEWNASLAGLMAAWPAIVAAQQAEVTTQVQAAMASNDPSQQLGEIQPDTHAADALLLAAMVALAALSVRHVIDEAARQDVHIDPIDVDKARLEAVSTSTVQLLGQELAVSAARRATQFIGDTSMSAEQVAENVKSYIAELSTAGAQTQLGGALSGAQNQARLDTYEKAGSVQNRYSTLQADETLDGHTCEPCRDIDGTLFGSTANAASIVAARAAYPFGQYVDCEGRQRCRGTITATWLPVVKGS